jgi:predicted peptidase
MPKTIIHLFLIIMSAQNIFSQTDLISKFKFCSHYYKRITIPYRLFIPDSISQGKKYPLVLALHGSGERGKDNEAQLKANKLATSWADSGIQNKNPCFIVAPQCYLPQKWVLKYTNDEDLSLSPQLANVMDLLDTLSANYPVDTNRIYITGLSMGGFGTWDLITRFPEKFAAAVPVCGGGNPAKISKDIKLPLWIFHGRIDPIVPVERSREMLRALEKNGRKAVYTHCRENDTTGLTKKAISDLIKDGHDFFYTEFKDVGHDSWVPAYNYPLLFEWVFKQKKK